MRTATLVSLLVTLQAVAADTCYSYGYGYYNCNDGGLSYGARIGIGIGVAVGVLLLVSLCSYWRRRQLKRAYAKYKPPAFPGGGADNPYANNPPPPQNASAYAGNPYGSNPPPPAQSYYPGQTPGASFAAYKTPQNTGGAGGVSRQDTGALAPQSTAGMAGVGAGAGEGGEGGHEHGYEWAQARENERLEREQASAEAPPPGYDVVTNSTGTSTGHYAPPAGPPPGKRAGEGAV